MHDTDSDDKAMPKALAMLASERPRNVGWFGAAALLFGDWGTSRLYVLGLAFLVAGRTSFWLIAGMSLLILAVGWAYTQICRIYPDGGGVYTAAKHRSRLLGVIGALLLFADYTVTASLSAVDAFHYFGLGRQESAEVVQADAGDDKIHFPDEHRGEVKAHERLFQWNSPGLWAIVAIAAIGAFNLMGPKHTAGFAVFAAAGMIVITVLVLVFALPNLDWHHVQLGTLHQNPLDLWRAFVFVVLALSGVEAIANLTGVMKKPDYNTARKSIWLVAAEVATLNLLLALAMVQLAPPREAHTGDMMAFIASKGLGPWGEWPVRIIGGLLLLSASNTAFNGLMSIVYVMSRDGEMPQSFQVLNGFGAPVVGAIIAAGAPALVLLFAHDLETLASLYAIGVVGAVAMDSILGALHPRMRKWYRKTAIFLLGLFLIGVWITLAFTKLPALIFVSIVLAVGLTLRGLTRRSQRRRPRPSLLKQAIVEQLPPDAWSKPKLLLATAGSVPLAEPALKIAKQENAALVVCFILDMALNFRVEPENLVCRII